MYDHYYSCLTWEVALAARLDYCSTLTIPLALNVSKDLLADMLKDLRIFTYITSAEFVAAVYAEMRAQEAAAKVPHSYTTARTLLSILRLSQALARLRFSNTIAQVCCLLRATT